MSAARGKLPGRIGRWRFKTADFLGNLSIFNKIFYGIILIVMIVIVASGISSYVYSRNIYIHQTTDNATRLVENINTGFEDILDQVDRIIMSIYADSDSTGSKSMKAVISTRSNTSTYEELRSLQAVENFFQRLMFLRKDFKSVYIYLLNEKTYSYTVNGANKLDYDPREEAWFKKTMEANGKTVISAPHLPYQLNDSNRVISFSRVLKNIDDPGAAPFGIILIDLSVESISNIVDKVKLGPASGVVFLDQQGKVIYENHAKFGAGAANSDIMNNVAAKNDGRFTLNLPDTEYLVTFSTSNITGWKLLTFTPYSEIERDVHKLLLFDLLLAAAALIFVIWISYKFTRLIYAPIVRLKNGMLRVKQGDFDFQLEHISRDELGQLVANFNTMIFTIKTLILERYEERLARKDAEFKYLQAQINPHFIYNTLQIISSMAIVKKVPEISTASKSLAKMLRYSIHTKSKRITLKEEIENVVSYLEIQKLRFREFLNYELDVDEEVYGYHVLKLILQPVVENAVTHGIEAKGENGKVKVTVKRIGESIHMEVWDNGKGMSDEKLDLLKQSMDANEKESPPAADDNHNHMGLKNIQQRIKMIYGQEYGLKVDSVYGEWMKVTIHVPAERTGGDPRK
ncbi:sensor histidine kinase [Paenibacillus sp. P26]|nr:sensor histidine kinase [Paenibacillus sp. P26]